MSRGAQPIKQGAIAQALKAAANAGFEVQRVEIDQTAGKIIVFFGKPDEPEMAKIANAEWDNLQ
jgi:hypothetical protein